MWNLQDRILDSILAVSGENENVYCSLILFAKQTHPTTVCIVGGFRELLFSILEYDSNRNGSRKTTTSFVLP